MKDFWDASSVISEKDKSLISRVGDALRNIPYNLKRIFDLNNDDEDLLNILKRIDRETS